MISHSILVERPNAGNKTETAEVPDFFADLNLDQIVSSITAGKVEYNLKPFFYKPLSDIDTIRYRHEVMQDLQHDILYEKVASFAQRMRAVREHVAQADKRFYRYQKESWFLEAVGIYCDAVNCLADDLAVTDLRSRGLLIFREYFSSYSKSEPFTSLFGETNMLKADLSTVKYSLLIRDSSIKVRKSTSEIDYTADVEKTFEKFKQGLKALEGMERERQFRRIVKMVGSAQRVGETDATARLRRVAAEVIGITVSEFKAAIKTEHAKSNAAKEQAKNQTAAKTIGAQTLFQQLLDEFGVPAHRNEKGQPSKINERFFAELMARENEIVHDADDQKFYLYTPSNGRWERRSAHALKKLLSSRIRQAEREWEACGVSANWIPSKIGETLSACCAE
jgi:hypothetical protein